MPGTETKIGGETSQDNEDVPQPAPTAVRKQTGQINVSSTVIGDEVNIHEIDVNLVKDQQEGLNGTSKEDIDSWKIDITDEEISIYTTEETVKEKLKSLDDPMKSQQPKIEKVPLILSENTNFQKYYKPRMVSIGPYHHGSRNLDMMQNLKLKKVKHFIDNHHLRKEVIYSKIRKKIRDLRKFYEEEAVKEFQDDDLAWMFFLDGCIILHYIYCAMENNNYAIKSKNNDNKHGATEGHTWNTKLDCVAFVKHDLFLLENQLPYLVLKLVISCLDSIEEKKKFRNYIEDFILHNIKEQWEMPEELHNKPCLDKEPAHLLDLLRAKILQPVKESQTSHPIVRKSINYLVEIVCEPLEKVKDLFELIGKAFDNFSRKQKHHLQFCRNVEELKAAGIRFKRNNTVDITNIDFNLGTLKIHPIKVDHTTISMFLNLIAYEMTPSFGNHFEISSYIAFLDSLIDRTQDVKELRDEQILCNILGSDEEVAKLFNEISTYLVPNPKKYSDVKKNIQKRYKNTLMTGIAQLTHLHFQSPWSIIAFLAAVAILAFTIIQTVYTTLGYYYKSEEPYTVSFIILSSTRCFRLP